jgi:hypothetical protein
MALVLTSDPRHSARNSEFFYAYYNNTHKSIKTRKGGEPTVFIHRACATDLRAGFEFDEDQVVFDPDLGGSYLAVDYTEGTEDPSIPSSEDGWKDPDPITAITATSQTFAKPSSPRIPTGPLLDPTLAGLIEQVCRAYNYTSKLVGCIEKPRSMEVQKLTVTALIPFIKARGFELSEEEEKSIRI